MAEPLLAYVILLLYRHCPNLIWTTATIWCAIGSKPSIVGGAGPMRPHLVLSEITNHSKDIDQMDLDPIVLSKT